MLMSGGDYIRPGPGDMRNIISLGRRPCRPDKRNAIRQYGSCRASIPRNEGMPSKRDAIPMPGGGCV